MWMNSSSPQILFTSTRSALSGESKSDPNSEPREMWEIAFRRRTSFASPALFLYWALPPRIASATKDTSSPLTSPSPSSSSSKSSPLKAWRQIEGLALYWSQMSRAHSLPPSAPDSSTFLSSVLRTLTYSAGSSSWPHTCCARAKNVCWSDRRKPTILSLISSSMRSRISPEEARKGLRTRKTHAKNFSFQVTLPENRSMITCRTSVATLPSHSPSSFTTSIKLSKASSCTALWSTSWMHLRDWFKTPTKTVVFSLPWRSHSESMSDRVWRPNCKP
mmetsp:Transcript_29764/g.63371  ORF Transcript_29764/g.63371 Transcript_29764/m.63371 type:complete len:276 (+) Transcript_29764:183-1010(+)